ncbi:hypothetical protein D3C81_131880 [compost metagenome]
MTESEKPSTGNAGVHSDHGRDGNMHIQHQHPVLQLLIGWVIGNKLMSIGGEL